MRALIALAISALVLLASLPFYVHGFGPYVDTRAKSQSISGRLFNTVMGTTYFRGETLVLRRLQHEGGTQSALVAHRVRLPAEDYPLLRYNLEGIQPALDAQFFWRTAETSDAMFFMPIPEGTGGTTYAHLAAHPDWRGTITDIALYFKGDLRDQSLVIPGITFEPYSWQGLVRATILEWTQFRGWTVATINYLLATPLNPGSETLSPTLALTAWAGLALVLLYGASIVRGGENPVSYGLVVLIPWIALDLLWQNEVNTQLQQTRYAFGGKTVHEKHLADIDSFIYSYTRQLKEEVLPTNRIRIFLLEDSRSSFVKRRTEYYLLPHSIYSHATLPPSHGVHAGDYILALGDVPGLSYLASQGKLAWQPDNQVDVKLVDAKGSRRLFLVLPDDRDGERMPGSS